MKKIEERVLAILLAELDKELDIKCVELQEKQKELGQKKLFFSGCMFFIVIFLLQMGFSVFNINYIFIIIMYQVVALVVVLPIIFNLTNLLQKN